MILILVLLLQICFCLICWDTCIDPVASFGYYPLKKHNQNHFLATLFRYHQRLRNCNTEILRSSVNYISKVYNNAGNGRISGRYLKWETNNRNRKTTSMIDSNRGHVTNKVTNIDFSSIKEIPSGRDSSRRIDIHEKTNYSPIKMLTIVVASCAIINFPQLSAVLAEDVISGTTSIITESSSPTSTFISKTIPKPISVGVSSTETIATTSTTFDKLKTIDMSASRTSSSDVSLSPPQATTTSTNTADNDLEFRRLK